MVVHHLRPKLSASQTSNEVVERFAEDPPHTAFTLLDGTILNPYRFRDTNFEALPCRVASPSPSPVVPDFLGYCQAQSFQVAFRFCAIHCSTRPVVMDFGAGEAIKHEVVVKAVNVRHLIDFSQSTVSIAKELRYCVIALCISWATVVVVRSWSHHRRGD